MTQSCPAPAYSSADTALKGITNLPGLKTAGCVVDPELFDLVGGKNFGIRFERDRILQNAQFFFNSRFAVTTVPVHEYFQEIMPG